ncbi:hypothetical protein ABD74_20530 [Brevibacillus laterosporus]|nr:hypothetical protein [Brevibacillus laterosporus]
MVRWDAIGMLVPVSAVCLILAIMLSRYVTVLSFGEDVVLTAVPAKTSLIGDIPPDKMVEKKIRGMF